ncbi:serine/threonine-protein kinase/endoribonuclease IRE2 [Daphnia magna]|uniref:serine/threonine-protein kinase/endoribonuclease IRE2 n=1 Tax=Daphnia magna TaxID=35525 RepID=UPI001E1BA2E6|nr:serine/threonine-protein kinase/endoribonuclease IRE2 [Daphnia magna]
MSSTKPVNVDGIQFNRSDHLGSGGFGSVYRGKYKDQSIAVKRILKKADRKPLVDKELNILKQLDHPNIVKLLHFASDDDFDYFALELCDASLDQVFPNQGEPRKYNGPMLPNNFEVFSQLASGLKHIHSRNLIHRDIKPENILISVKPTDQGNETTMKWADFGLSREVSERGTYKMSGIRGTTLWFSPEELEILSGKNILIIQQTKGSIKSDVYAEGLVFGYILLKGSHIYGENDSEIRSNIMNDKSVNMNQIHESHWARNLIKKMLSKTPDTRITSEEVVIQLQSIKIELKEGEQKLLRLCADTCPTSDFRNQIKTLIRLGIDLNAKNKVGWNALHLFCRYNSTPHLIEAIKVLIDLGIDKDAKTNIGSSALHLLCRNNSAPHLIEAIKVLIDLGIDLNAKNNDGWNALHFLCYNNSTPHLIEAIKVLIELGINFGIDLNAKDNSGWNALHFLCRYNSTPQLIEAIQELIKLGIDKDAKTENMTLTKT